MTKLSVNEAGKLSLHKPFLLPLTAAKQKTQDFSQKWASTKRDVMSVLSKPKKTFLKAINKKGAVWFSLKNSKWHRFVVYLQFKALSFNLTTAGIVF